MTKKLVEYGLRVREVPAEIPHGMGTLLSLGHWQMWRPVDGEPDRVMPTPPSAHPYPFVSSRFAAELSAAKQRYPDVVYLNIEPYYEALDLTQPSLPDVAIQSMLEGVYEHMRTCLHMARQVFGGNVVGYYTQWPFWRMAGLDEPGRRETAERLAWQLLGAPSAVIRSLYPVRGLPIREQLERLQSQYDTARNCADRLKLKLGLLIRPTRVGDLTTGEVLDGAELDEYMAIIERFPADWVGAWIDGRRSASEFAGFVDALASANLRDRDRQVVDL